MKTFKILSFVLFIVAATLISLSSARASVSATSTNLIGSPTWVKGNSATTSALRISLTATAGETLTAVTIAVSDASSTGFTTSDLAALATSSGSGISLYSESAGFLEASTTPAWTGSGPYMVTINLKDAVALSETPSVFFVVFKTAPGLNSDTHKFIVSVFPESITTTGTSPTINSASTASISIDDLAPAGINSNDFTLTNHQLSPKNGISIGMQGSTVKVYVHASSTLFGQATLGPSGNFAPISTGSTTPDSVDVQVNDPAGNVSNLAEVTAEAPLTVTGVAAFTDRIIVNFSNNIDGMQAMNCTPNYVVGGSALTCGGMGNPFIDFNGNKVTIRGLNLTGTTSFAIPESNTLSNPGGGTSLTAYSSSSIAIQALTLPNITSLSPRSGAVGATVTITGTGFGVLGGGAIGDNSHKVMFSGGFSQQTGPNPPVEADYTGATWSATSIVVKVPSGAQGGPVNIKAGDLMNDMGQNTFFDIAGSYTAKVYYSSGTSTPMADGDNTNIRIVVGGQNGETVYYVGDGYMTYATSTDTFTITGVSSMGYTWAYDITGTHLNSAGKEVNTSATQNLFMPATTRVISGTITLGSECTAGGYNKQVVIFASPENISSGFKEQNPAFFRTGASNCTANYAIGVPTNGVYRIEAHIPPSMSGGITASTAYTDPDSQLVTISDSTLTSTNNFNFSAATHRIVGHVVKPASGSFGAEERGKLWVFAYQPQGGKGTGAQVAEDGSFTLNVSKGVWKVGVGGDNMPFPVEVQVEVDDTYEMGDAPKGPTIIIAPPSDFIEGYVKDAAGNGLANVSLYAWLEGGPGNGNARTDSQGYYKMYVGPGANYHIGANSQSFGFLGEQQGITVSSETHPTVNFNVNSANNYVVSGTVTKGGVGLQQAFIFVTQGERGQMLGSGGTDSDGAYSLRVSSEANSWIHVGLPGKGEVYKENLGTISTSTTKNITLLASIIKVRISPATDFTQAFVGVHSDQGGGFSDVDVAVASSSYREYQIDIPRPGSGSTTYYVEGGIPGYGPLAQNSIAVNSDGTFTEASGTANDGIIEYTLGGFYSVSGTVTGSGNGGAWIWTSGSGGGSGAQTADDGTYTLKLRNGTYDIGVGKPGYIGNKITVTVNGANLTGQNLTLTTASSTITGTIYLPGGVTKVTNARVWAQNNTGGWAGGSTDANGEYSLNVGSGSWDVQAAYDGYNSSSTPITAPATGANITLSVIAGFNANLKNSPITPSSGGIIQETGIRVDFPKNSLGTESNAGTVEVKNTTNVPSVASTKVIGNARDITARNSSNQNITTLSGSITIELTVTKAEIQEQGLSFTQVQGMKISYWDSTANNWVEIPTTVTLHPATSTSISNLDSDPAVTLSGTVSHLSSFAPTVPADDAPTTPTGLAATPYRPTQINLAWNVVSGATSYDIYRGTSTDGLFPRVGSEPTVSSGLTTSYSDTGLTASTTYYYKISALNGSGESAASAAVQATTTAVSEIGGYLCTGLNCPVEGIVIVAPSASLAAGTYTSTQSATLSATSANSIHYTTNGTDPTCTSGTTISGSSGTISVASSQTVKAISCYANNNHSTVASFAYVLQCAITSVTNGSVAAYSSCAITCNSGYTLSGSTCVANSTGGGGGGGSAITYCSAVTYGAWQSTCFNNVQYRNVLTQTPTSCTLTAAQQLEQQRTCTAEATTIPPVVPPVTLPATLPTSSGTTVLQNIAAEAAIVDNNNRATLLAHLGISADIAAERAGLVKYKTILDLDKKISAEERLTINDFIVYGTQSTHRLGAGERAAVINSYYQAYGKLPNSETEWSDVLKIASGRWPVERSAKAEAQAKMEFKKVYARNAVMTNNIDENAIMVIAYGLLPLQRNLNSEKVAIKTFRWVYGHAPVNALAWNIVRAIAYSGATR